MPDSVPLSVTAPHPALSPHEILRLRALKEAVGGFAHEISQPLNALMIASQLVKMAVEKSALNQSERNFILQRLDTVTTQVRKAGNIIDTLRTFVRGKTSSTDSTNLGEALAFALSLMEQQLSARGIRLIKKISEQPLLTKLDRSASEYIIIAAIAYTRDRIEALMKQNKDSSLRDEEVLEIETILSHRSPTIRVRWSKEQEKPSIGVSDDLLREARLVMTSAGGNINVTLSHLVLQFPASE